MYLHSAFKDESEELEQMKRVERGKDMDSLLYDLLTTHSHKDFGEDAVRKIITDYLKDKTSNSSTVDEKGNLYINVRNKNKTKSTVMFSCHLDTVDSSNKGIDRILLKTDDEWIRCAITKQEKYLTIGKEKVNKYQLESLARKNDMSFDTYTVRNGKVYGSDEPLFGDWVFTGINAKVKSKPKQKANVLGADDKLGCYIMCRMIEQGIPGMYVFHHGEEAGCVGSKYIASEHKEFAKEFDYCIAFDRAGYNDIITKQSGSTCCSTEFATALSEQLNRRLPPMEQMKPCPNGVYTDSASYVGLIPECTNVSVGYKSQHTSEETFDHEWLTVHLLPALFQVDWDTLPVKRDPSVKEYGYRRYGYYGNYGFSSEDEEFASSYTRQGSLWAKKDKPKSNTQAAVTRSVKKGIKNIRSSFDRFEHVMSSTEIFDPEAGFDETETEEMKISRILRTFLSEEMSDFEKAELVLRAYETNSDDVDEFNSFNSPWY